MKVSATRLAFLLACCASGGILFAADQADKPAAKADAKAPAPAKVEVPKAEPAKAEPASKAADVAAAPATAKEPAKPAEQAVDAEPSADEIAIRHNAQDYVNAYEGQDAEKLAALWAPNAVWVDGKTGDRVKGRAAIQAQFEAIFAEAEPTRLNVQIQDIHFSTPTVAVEDGTATIVRAGEELKTTAYTAVHVLVDGKWLIDSIRETDLPPAPTAQEELSQLDWLEGTWVDESEDSTVITKYHWTPNRTFLVQSFSVVIADQIDMQGTQIIGWDASQQRIRSWLFDSDGGFAEGNWEAEEGRWVIRQASTLPDGRHGSSLNVLTKLDDDSFTWKSSARQIDGVMQPNVDEFTVVRQSEDEALISSEAEEQTDATE